MKECFGAQFGGLIAEEMHPDEEKRQECYYCQDFDACYKVTLIRNMHKNRVETRRGVRGIRNSIGGSHSEFPVG